MNRAMNSIKRMLPTFPVVDPDEKFLGHGYTPLMMAVMRGHDKSVEVLLKEGADMDALNSRRKSALNLAFSPYSTTSVIQVILRELRKKCKTSEDMAKRLINAKCKLCHAALAKDAKIIEYMIKNGSRTDVVNPRNKKTALHIAVELGDIESAKVLLKNGIYIDSYDIRNLTPFLYVCKNYMLDQTHRKDILRLLLDEYSSRSIWFNSGKLSSMTSIVVEYYPEGISVLLDSEFGKKFKNKPFTTNILHCLAKHKNFKLTEELKPLILNYGSNVDIPDVDGNTALSLAVEKRNIVLVEFLLDQGANPNFKNCGPVPIYSATRDFTKQNPKRERCIELLLQHDADAQIFFFCSRMHREPVLDAGIETNDSLKRMEPIIAQLAIDYRLGKSIQQIILDGINGRIVCSNYFYNCQLLLSKEIFGKTILQLLTEDDRKIDKYLKNKKLVEKLIRISYKQRLSSSYSYYYNRLEKRITQISQRKMLKAEASRVLSKLSRNRFGADNLVVRKMTSYMHNRDLRKLYDLC